MAGEDEHAFAAVAGGEVVIQAFVADKARGVGGGVGGHPAELGEQPAQVAVLWRRMRVRSAAGIPGKARARLRCPTRRRRPRAK